jgi:tetratricopeptide (TPR) repeat protein
LTQFRKKPKAPAAPSPSGRRYLLPIAALWLLSLAAYSNSFSAGLIYDNTPIVLHDPRVHAVTGENLRLILTNEYWYPSNGNGLYRPLATLSYLFNYAMLGNGGSPAGYHVVNWLIHSVNASLVFALGMVLFGETLPAFAASALWAVHPILTESVTNVIGRADLLAAFGVLAGLLCFVRACRGGERKRWLVTAALAAGIGVFSKESGIVVLAAVALYDFAFQRRKPWKTRAAGYAAVVLPCIVFLAARFSVMASSPAFRVPFPDDPVAGAGFLAGRLTAIKVIGKEVALLVWPARLSCDYSYNAIPLSTGLDAGLLGGVAVLLAGAATMFWGWRRNRAIFFLVGFGFAALLPTANLLLPIGALMAERFLYLPFIGFAGCLAAALFGAARRLPWLPPVLPRAVLAALVLACGARTFARNFDWRDEHTLWASAEAAVPASYRPHTTLAEGDLDTALRETGWALAILDPLPDDHNIPVPYINAGKVYGDKGDSVPAPESFRWHRKAVDTLLRARRIQAALDAAGGRAHPTEWSVLDAQLGREYLRLMEYAPAAEAFQRALGARYTPELFPELATAWQGTGDFNRAAISLFEGMEADPRDTRLAAALVQLYSTAMPGSCAVLSAGTQYRINPQCPLVKQHACTASRDLIPALERAGRSEEAARIRSGAAKSGCQ